jgi:TRAP-type mannitol/chloroaromatic compound transport system permease small subunit
MRSIVNALEKLTSGVGYTVSILIVPLIVATCYEVFARYLFGAPTIWVFELGYSVMGVHFLMGSALTLKKGGHIRIDVIYGHFSPKTKAAIDLFFYVFLLLPFLVFLSNWMLDYAIEAMHSGERTGQSAWNPHIWPFRLLISSGIILLTVQVVAEILKCAMTLFFSDDYESREA